MTSTTPPPSERPGPQPEDEHEPELGVEIVKDLDVEDADDDQIRGGACPDSRPTGSPM